MSLYEYACKKCGHSFKKMFLIVEDTPFICPRCGDNKEKERLNYISLFDDQKIGNYSNESSKWLSFSEWGF
ncbi:FmdB family zinc ribbon protein [Thermodesulfobacteriota bacterium]